MMSRQPTKVAYVLIVAGIVMWFSFLPLSVGRDEHGGFLALAGAGSLIAILGMMRTAEVWIRMTKDFYEVVPLMPQFMKSDGYIRALFWVVTTGGFVVSLGLVIRGLAHL
jgi:hypothetical protein